VTGSAIRRILDIDFQPTTEDAAGITRRRFFGFVGFPSPSSDRPWPVLGMVLESGRAATADRNGQRKEETMSRNAAVQVNPDWTLESAAAFHVAVPAGDGSCSADSLPVYRLYSNGQCGAPNHRLTTDFSYRAQMLREGWMSEGFGPDGVEMCSPR
jgi:hypothetical protein